MKEEQLDRRVQRTRKALEEALVTLIEQKGYDAITVQDIINEANLGRSTFYAHYIDKDDLLKKSMSGLVHSMMGHLEKSDSPQDLKQNQLVNTLPLFRHVKKHYRLYKAMLGGRGIDMVIKAVRHHLAEHIEEQIEKAPPSEIDVPPPVRAAFLAGAVLTLLTYWLDTRMPYSAEEMDSMFQRLTNSRLCQHTN